MDLFKKFFLGGIMKKFFISCILLFNTSILTPCILKQSSTLNQIFNHLGYYRLVHSKFHQGNLLQHSLWTARSLAQWFDEKHFWVKELYALKDLVILGGLLHDIGKAGDYNFYYRCKHNHQKTGYRYILNQNPFFLHSTQVIDFEKLYEELSISEEEQKILGVLIAMHLELGNAMKKFVHNGNLDKACSQYLKAFQYNCQIMSIQPTLNILRSAIAVSAADVRGISPNSYVNDLLKKILGNKLAFQHNKSLHSGINAYEKFDLEGRGKLVSQRLCRLFIKRHLLD